MSLRAPRPALFTFSNGTGILMRFLWHSIPGFNQHPPSPFTPSTQSAKRLLDCTWADRPLSIFDATAAPSHCRREKKPPMEVSFPEERSPIWQQIRKTFLAEGVTGVTVSISLLLNGNRQ
ncbi:hypothetical protein CEXT_653271 [Caerostris extrusa]|uniref:Uncharacterized protein n=1 Tax=Caerostris extrusa TaxID=172846 RepID=A0AAV4WAC9_CAEEX|nr:hypothetical protein CEXT_653271 [Caerostris extrusa]